MVTRMGVSHCTFGFGENIRRDLRNLSLPHVYWAITYMKCWMKLLGGLNSPQYVTARGSPQQTPLLNSLVQPFLTEQINNMQHRQGRNSHIFLRGKVIFPGVKCSFPVENSHFGRPKTNFRRFLKWKAKKKKKKKKKRPSPLFYNFSYFHFQFSTFPFTIFLIFFSIFTLFPFLLTSFFPIRQQKFPGQKSLGTLCPPPPACYATEHRGV